jgi:hypothetical protein
MAFIFIAIDSPNRSIQGRDHGEWSRPFFASGYSGLGDDIFACALEKNRANSHLTVDLTRVRMACTNSVVHVYNTEVELVLRHIARRFGGCALPDN